MVDSTDISGWTPLNHAPQRGDSDMVKLLLAANAKVDLASKSGTTALITAVKHGHREAVKLLLAANAEINTNDNDGTTAITWATKSGGGSWKSKGYSIRKLQGIRRHNIIRERPSMSEQSV